MGLAYLAPIGAQNLFVINTALTAPLGIALVTAGIVAFFDISLALACFWGIGLVIEHSLLLQKALLGGGGLILIYLAWQLLHAQVQTDTSAYSQPTLWQTATLAFTVTWFNPQAVIDGTLMLGAFRSSLPADTASLFISGVAAASCLWFFGLTGIFKTCCQNLRPSPSAMDQPHLRRRYFCLRPQTALYLWADAVKTMNTHIKKQQLFKLLLLFCSDPFNLLL